MGTSVMILVRKAVGLSKAELCIRVEALAVGAAEQSL